MKRPSIFLFFGLFASALSALLSAPPTVHDATATSSPRSSSLKNFAQWNDLDSEQQDIFSQNNIIFYDPTECDGKSENQQMQEEGDNYDGIPTAGLSDLQSAFVDKWHNIAAKWSVAYGIPWETVVAQGILESASGTSNFAKYRNNFFGIGAFDSNPDNAYRYATAAEGWQGYFENIRKTPTYRNHGVFKEPNITDPLSYLSAIKAAGYATDPNYVSKVGSIVKAIQKRSQEKGWDSSAELAKKHPEMLSNAAKYASGAGSSPTEGSSYSSSQQAASETSAGNAGEAISKSAVKLAWPEGQKHAKNDPTSEYKKVLKETKLNSYGDAEVQIGASCDAFVKSVLWHSGVDKDFECCGVGNQMDYLEKHPEKYTEVKGWSWENAKPGDIVINPGQHIMLAVEVDGKIKRADASYGDRTGMIHNYYSGSFRAWRASGDVEQEDECVDDSSGAMDLNKTAIQLAWPADSGSHACSDVYPPFKEAALKVKSASFPSGCSCLGGSGCAVDHGSSCSVYAATVIRYSGVDPKMKIHNPGPMRDYMLTKPEIFEEVTSGYGKDTMRPGDIQVSESHIRMLVQLPDGTFHISEASLGRESEGRSAKPGQINKKEYNGSLSGGYRVFRAKNGVQSSPTSSVSSGSSGSAEGSMNISQTALELAYGIDDPENKGSDTTAQPSEAYSKALDATNSRSNYNGKGGCKWLGASCDSFAAVVLRYSGVDPKISTALATQWTYLPSKTDLYEEVTDGYNKDNMQAGDIHIAVGGGQHHIRILAQLPDGTFHIVEAGYGNGNTTGSGHCKSGRVNKKEFDGKLGSYRAFRAKNNTSANSATCMCRAEEATISNAVEGGMTDDQAQKLVNAYQKENGGCNCVTLSNWFIKKMLGLSAVSGNGGDIAYNLAKTHGLDHGSEPRPYAIFGTDGSMAVSYCGAYKCGHTGVVVAVKGDDVTTIEAASGNCGFTGVKHRKKSEFTSAKYGNQYVFTYTDSVLKKDELSKRLR